MHATTRTTLVALLALASAVLAAGGAAAQAGGAVLTKGEVPLKLITTRATQLHAEAEAASASAPCPAFKFWYVLPPEKPASGASRKAEDLPSLTKNGFYRVAAGDGEDEFKGWIAAKDAVEWHHRQAVQFAESRGRKPASFFRTGDDATAAARSGEVVKATHREPGTSASDLVVMPLLEVKDVKVDDESMQLYEVAFMAGRPETTPQASNGARVPGVGEAVTREKVLRESTIDIVFVIDTTSSMEPVIAQVRSSVGEVSRRLASDAKLRDRLRFGLVAYRDTVPEMSGMEYLTRVFCTLAEGKDHQVFLDRLGQLRESPVSSVDYPEDVLAGIDVAMSFDALKWNPLGWKQIVVVGDSSIKEADHPVAESRNNQGNRTIAGVLAKAQPGGGLESLTQGGFVLSAVRVKDARAAEDHLIGDQQFGTLIAGRTYNGNLISAVGGVNPQDFSAELSSEILKAIGNFDSAIVQGGAAGGSAAAKTDPSSGAASGASAADFPWPVLDILEAVGDGTSAAQGVQFASRYATEFDAEGNRLFVPHLFLRKGSLQSFTAMLDFLQGQLDDAGEPGNKDVTAIVKGMQAVSVSLNLAEPITADMPVDRFLSLLLGFPLKNPIFQKTIADLAAMSQTDYDDWVRSVKAQKDTLKALTENAHLWKKLHHDADERSAHAFIRMSDLP